MTYTHVKEHSSGWTAGVYLDVIEAEFTSEQEAKEWAETRMSEFKKEFILSLIVEVTSKEYNFGGLLCIDKIKDDSWRVSNEREYLFQGTLKECKNYIVSCF